MDRLKFYNIDDKYIEYLYQFDKKVPFNKNSKRPYIGIILEINEITYFAPMFSPKQQHNKYKANATHIRIGKDLGMIKLNNMIPVNKENLKYINFNDIQDKKYKNLLIQQNNFIQLNTDEIRQTAEKLYKFVTIDKKDFFIKLCCDFKLLEEKCKNYNNIMVEELKEVKNIFISNKPINIKDLKELEKQNYILNFEYSSTIKRLKNTLKQHNIEIEANMQYDITELRINAVKRGLGIGYVMKEAVKNELEKKELYEVKLPIELPISKINLIYIKQQLTQADKKFIKNYLKN